MGAEDSLHLLGSLGDAGSVLGWYGTPSERCHSWMQPLLAALGDRIPEPAHLQRREFGFNTSCMPDTKEFIEASTEEFHGIATDNTARHANHRGEDCKF